MREKEVRNAVNFTKSKISQRNGLLCFSEDKYNPVQWAHYADNHKGVCLGFDIPDRLLRKVKYVSERLAKSILDDPDKNEKLLTTKFSHWSYEQEHRLIVVLSKYKPDSNGLLFEEFSDALSLKEVYIGCQSKLEFNDIVSAFQTEDKSVIVKHARPSFKDFRIVWDQSRKSVRA
jgi:hypothetical protein